MSFRTTRLRPAASLALSLSLLTLDLACGGSATSSSAPPPPLPVTPQGEVTLALTDAPAANWSHLIVKVQRVVLKRSTDASKAATVFDGAANPASVDLVKLDNVAELLAKTKVPVGTYDQVELTVDTDPAHVLLIDATGKAVPSSQLRVEGGPAVLVPLRAPLVVTEGSSSVIQIEFDLSHPLFITTAPNGTVVIQLVLQHKENPGDSTQLQLKEARGTVSAADPTGFTLATDKGQSLVFKVAGFTQFYDADAKALGSLGGLSVGKQAGVLARLEANGQLTALRVLYAQNLGTLAATVREGHIVNVNPTTKTLEVHNEQGVPSNVSTTPATKILFESDATSLLPFNALQRGFQVRIEFQDGSASPLVAHTITIQHAMDEGVAANATASSLTLYRTLSNRLDSTLMPYAEATGFQWWYAGKEDTKQDGAALAQLLAGAAAGSAESRQNALVDLGWNASAGAWQARRAVLLGAVLPVGAITTPYSAASRTFVMSYSLGGTPKSATLTLVESGPGTTQVLQVVNSSSGQMARSMPPSQWPTVLVTNVKGALVTAVPQSDGSLLARTVVVYSGF